MSKNQTFEEALATRKKSDKKLPASHYSVDGDCLFVYFEDTPYYATYVDSVLTVFEAISDSRLVGFQVKGVKPLMADSVEMKVDVRMSPPIVELMLEGFTVDKDGVDRKVRRRQYAKVVKAVNALGPTELHGLASSGC